MSTLLNTQAGRDKEQFFCAWWVGNGVGCRHGDEEMCSALLESGLTQADESDRLISKRLRVILQDPDYREIQRMARSRHMSIAEWVRQALDLARRREPLHDTAKKLAAIRAAVQHKGPTADIEVMLAEIERGDGSGFEP